MGLTELKFESLWTYIGKNIEDFFSDYKSEQTKKSYKNALKKVFGDLFQMSDFKYMTKEKLESLSVRDYKDYFNDMYSQVKEDDSPKYSNATINQRISAVKRLYKFLYSEDIIKYDILKFDSLKSFPDTRQEIEMIPFDLAMKYVEFFKNEDKGLEKSLIVKLAIESALRAEELVNLDWNNFIESEDGVILKSHGTKKGKGNKEFIDKIDHKIYQELLQLKSIGNKEKLFNLTYPQLRHMMDRANKAINDTEINYNFHSFKKLAVTMCYLNSGNCIDTAMKKARHSNVNTTMRYLRLTNLNITGIMSAQVNTEDDVYKNASQEELIQAISKMRPEFKLLLNSEIKKIRNK